MDKQTQKPTLMRDLAQEAALLIIRENKVTISLLQRRFLLGYQAALVLAKALEQRGVITKSPSDDTLILTSEAQSLREVDPDFRKRELFKLWAINPFEGGDGGDPGSPETPSIWLFGIEHGDAVNIEQEPTALTGPRDYSVDKQLVYPFNRKAFKLLAAVHGEPVEHFEGFARHHQPWVPGKKGYLKGNLYPYPSRTWKFWSPEAIEETGFERKQDYIRWCNSNRVPAIAQAVQVHRPRLFIGIGNKFARNFSHAYFGSERPLEEYLFTENGRVRRIFHATDTHGTLVVIPHLNFYAHCLNSDLSIQMAGDFISTLIN